MRMDLSDIEKLGAQARNNQLSELDNPFLSSANLPVNTEETLEDWKKKHDAWQRGFILEDML